MKPLSAARQRVRQAGQLETKLKQTLEGLRGILQTNRDEQVNTRIAALISSLETPAAAVG